MHTPASDKIILVKLPNDIGDSVLCLPALNRIVEKAEKLGQDVKYYANGASPKWLAPMMNRYLDVVSPDDVDPADVSALFDFDYSPKRGQPDRFAGIPYYAPNPIKINDKDTATFAAGTRIGEKHLLALNAECLKDAGFLDRDASLPAPSLPSSWTSSYAVKQAQQKFGLEGQDYALMIPSTNATRTGRQWPPGRFAAIAEKMAEAGITPVLIGGPIDAERRLCAKIETTAKAPVINLCGETQLLEIAALARGAQFTFGSDTGPMHIAAVTGTPSYAFFGYFSDEKTWRSPNTTSLQYKKKTTEWKPDVVWEAIGKTLNRPGLRPTAISRPRTPSSSEVWAYRQARIL